MELQRSDINTIENIVHKTGIPYEGIRIELIDHLASMVEYKMQENSRLNFEEALSRVSHNMKQTIGAIKAAMFKKTIKKLILNSFDFSNWITGSSILFFGVVAYLIFLNSGPNGMMIPTSLLGAYTSSFLGISVLAFFVMKFRMRHIEVGNNYKLIIQKKFGWVPLIAVGGVSFTCILLFHSLISPFPWHYINKIVLIPISLSYGIFLTAVFQVTVFNIHQLKESVEIDDIFEYCHPSRFQLN